MGSSPTLSRGKEKSVTDSSFRLLDEANYVQHESLCFALSYESIRPRFVSRQLDENLLVMSLPFLPKDSYVKTDKIGFFFFLLGFSLRQKDSRTDMTKLLIDQKGPQPHEQQARIRASYWSKAVKTTNEKSLAFDREEREPFLRDGTILRQARLLEIMVLAGDCSCYATNSSRDFHFAFTSSRAALVKGKHHHPNDKKTKTDQQ